MATFDTYEDLELPKNIVDDAAGISLDIGASMIKLVFRTKGRKTDGRKKIKLPSLKLAKFPIEQLDQAFSLLQASADLRKPDNEPAFIHTTGIGCHLLKNTLCHTLKVNLRNLSELDCFVSALHYMSKNLPMSRVILPPATRGTAEAHELKMDLFCMAKKIKEYGHTAAKIPNGLYQQADIVDEAGSEGQPSKSDVTKGDLPLADAEDIYPCILCCIGSAAAISLVESDGSFEVIDGNTRAGRFFLGQGALLTGAQTFEEIIALAENGDDRNVSLYGGDLKVSCSNAEDLYATIPDDYQVCSFGKAAHAKLDTFKREDVARALVSSVAQDLTQVTYLNARIHDAKSVFFCGGFGTNDLIRNEITKFFSIHNVMNIKWKIQLYFLRHAEYLGAIGAFLASAETTQNK